MIKKPTYKELAKVLNVSEQAVKQYPKIKRDLMIFGLWKKNEIMYSKSIRFKED